jgi:hypothetical protein
MGCEELVKQWSRAVERSAKKVLASRKSTRKFMRKTGIVTKTGNKLAKAYR